MRPRVVIGLGLIGQLVVRLLVAVRRRRWSAWTSSRPAAAPPRRPARCSCAEPDEAGVREVERLLLERTGGLGADHILLAAGGDSNGPVEIAARLARDRARVVDIGKTKLDLPWNAYYEKELDVRFSRSYGPGRYDDRYELEGDRLPRRATSAGPSAATSAASSTCSASGRSTSRRWCPASIRSRTRSTSTASSATAVLRGHRVPALLRRRAGARAARSASTGWPRRIRRAHRCGAPRHGRTRTGKVRIGFIGAGNYATSMLLPHLRDNAERRARDGGHDQVAVRGERATQVRLRDDHHERRRRCSTTSRSTPCSSSPGTTRTPVWSAEALEARPRRLRREAARAERGTARAGAGHRSADRQRPTHGRLQPAVRTAVHAICATGWAPGAVRCRLAIS